MVFDIGRTYKFQREETKDILVDLWRLDVSHANRERMDEVTVADAVSESTLRRNEPRSRRQRNPKTSKKSRDSDVSLLKSQRRR